MSISGLLLLEQWYSSRCKEITEHRIKSAIKYKSLAEGGTKSVLLLNSKEYLIEVEIQENAKVTYATMELKTNQILDSKSMEFSEQEEFKNFLDTMLDDYLEALQTEGA